MNAARGRAGREAGDADVENGAEHRRAQRAAEAAGEDIRRGGAAPHRPLDAVLDEDDRGDAQESHAESHDEGTDSREHRRALWGQQQKQGRAERKQEAAAAQAVADAEAAEESAGEAYRQGPADDEGGRAEPDVRVAFPPLVNNKEAVKFIADVAAEIVGEENMNREGP